LQFQPEQKSLQDLISVEKKKRKKTGVVVVHAAIPNRRITVQASLGKK
jgi:hypothetical protein